ncbi:hypothetical protein LPB41_29420 [Thalassospira sp. MA62]|nr:hypothetical protein [Thalassospira sp. MA62]
MAIFRTAACCLGAIALGSSLAGCMAPAPPPVSADNDSQSIVTPWGGPARSGQPAPTAQPASPVLNDNLVLMEDANRKALDRRTQQQINEARIALDILDRMAKRCVQERDLSACATLQSNWSTLSTQLHKTLSAVSGQNMQVVPMDSSFAAPDPEPNQPAAMPQMPAQSPVMTPANSPTGSAQQAPAATSPAPGLETNPAPTPTPRSQSPFAPADGAPSNGNDDRPQMERIIPMTDPGSNG